MGVMHDASDQVSEMIGAVVLRLVFGVPHRRLRCERLNSHTVPTWLHNALKYCFRQLASLRELAQPHLGREHY
jgi:hypothetical protein